ncbi:MAG: hypothetical protein LBL96_00690 [Clostridiales bacterium]|jgi:thiamine-monophosphate kinase|nr:hypothetical protein [Clostridiales bacterium]
MRKVSEYGEKNFISEVLSRFSKTAAESEKEDCVVIDLATLIKGQVGHQCIVYSIDHPGMIERPLKRELSRFRFYGRWIASCTLGDVIAMGARPKGFALDLAVQNNQAAYEVEEILYGISEVMAAYKCEFQGGNIDNNPLSTVGLGWGMVNSADKLIRRSGSAIGDKIIVTAPIGTGWASWVSRKMGIWNNLSFLTREFFTAYNDFPLAPIESILECSERGLFTSGMDLTDGLVEFAHTIARRNNVRVVIEEQLLSPSRYIREVAEHFRIKPEYFCLDPGYDTPLIHGYTVRNESVSAVKKIFQSNGHEMTVVGAVFEGDGVWYKNETDELKSMPMFCDDQFAVEDRLTRWKSFHNALS